MYKEKYNHVNIKNNDIIDEYHIGQKRNGLSKCNSLSKSQIKELKDLGVYLGNKIEKQFNEKIDLAKQAIEDGVIISNLNRKYRDTNLYDWVVRTVKRKYGNNQLALDDIQVIEKLVGKSLDELYCGKKEPVKVKVIDVIENKKIGIFESQKETTRVMRKNYDVKIYNSAIGRRITGKITKPYRGRFMFYYADENEEVTE